MPASWRVFLSVWPLKSTVFFTIESIRLSITVLCGLPVCLLVQSSPVCSGFLPNGKTQTWHNSLIQWDFSARRPAFHRHFFEPCVERQQQGTPNVNFTEEPPLIYLLPLFSFLVHEPIMQQHTARQETAEQSKVQLLSAPKNGRTVVRNGCNSSMIKADGQQFNLKPYSVQSPNKTSSHVILDDAFIQSDLQLIRLSRRHPPWSNVGLRALLKGPTAVQILSGIKPPTLQVQASSETS